MSRKLYRYLYEMIKAKELFIRKKEHFRSWSDISYAWRSEKREPLWLLKSYHVAQKLLNAFGQTSVPLQQTRHRTKGEWEKNVQCNEFFINLNCFNLKDFPLIREYTLWGGRKALKMCVLSDHESMLQFKKYLYLAKWNVEIFLFAQSLVGCFNWTAPWNLSLGKSTICDDLITRSLQSLWI